MENILKYQHMIHKKYEPKYDKLKEMKQSVVKCIYHDLTENALNAMDACNNWNKIFEHPVEFEDYMKCFTKIYKITNNTKLRDFMFHLLHKKIPTNKELLQIKTTKKFDFCEENDSIKHTLYTCKNIFKIWREWIVMLTKSLELA